MRVLAFFALLIAAKAYGEEGIREVRCTDAISELHKVLVNGNLQNGPSEEGALAIIQVMSEREAYLEGCLTSEYAKNDTTRRLLVGIYGNSSNLKTGLEHWIADSRKKAAAEKPIEHFYMKLIQDISSFNNSIQPTADASAD